MASAIRRKSYLGVFMVAAAMVLLCIVAGSSRAAAGDTTRINLDNTGMQAEVGGSGTPSISADGRYVAFISSATNLVESDTNGAQDVFVRDRREGTTERVSVDSSEAQANGRSLTHPSISADGRYVAFHSEASNLVPGDTNGKWDVFVRDRQEGTTERVSVDSSEAQANDNSSNGDWPSISANGRFVAFRSDATNLVPPGADSPASDIFVRDLVAGTTERVNLADGHNEYWWSSSDGAILPAISGDGRYVAFISASDDLVAGDTNTGPGQGYDVFVRDRQTWRTVRVSLDSAGHQASQGAACLFFCGPNTRSDLSISSDGRYVAWSTFASDLVASGADTNGVDDVFVRDRDTDEDGIFDEAGAVSTERVSVSGCGTQADGGSYDPEISPDGRYVTFSSGATNLVADDTNGINDVFVRDLEMGMTQRVSVVHGSRAQANGGSGSGGISADGTFVAFSSGATNLVEGDTNGLADIFVHERGNDTGLPNDCIAPITTRSVSPQPNAAGWNKDDVTVTLNATDDDSGVKEISYSINGGQSTTVEQSSVQTPPITNEGETTISYSATDNAGNVEEQQTFEVKLDKSAPTVPVITSPANNSFDTDGNVTLAGTAEEGSTIELFDGTTPKGTTPPVDSNGAWSKTLSVVGEGGHTYTAKATDVAGNTSGPSGPITVKVDTTKPTVIGTTPLNRATNVARGTNLTATFSEKMNPSTLTKSTFKLFKVNPDGTQTQVTDVVVSLSSDGLKAKLDPFGTKTTLLASNTKYKAVVTTGAKDLTGIALAQQNSWTFTTKP